MNVILSDNISNILNIYQNYYQCQIEVINFKRTDLKQLHLDLCNYCLTFPAFSHELLSYTCSRNILRVAPRTSSICG